MANNEPYQPSAFDQLQLAFGVDNERTRQLQQLRAGAAASIAAPQAQAAQIPQGLPVAQPAGGAGFFGGGNMADFLRSKFAEMRTEFNPTDPRVARAEAAAGVAQPQARNIAAKLQSIGKSF